MIERDVKNKLKRIIAKYEQKGHVFWSYWPVQTGFGKHGVPDCLLSLNGWLVGIEAKVDCKTPTLRQWHELRQVHESGAIAIVVDQHNINEVEQVFDALVRGDHVAARKIALDSTTTYPAHV